MSNTETKPRGPLAATMDETLKRLEAMAAASAALAARWRAWAAKQPPFRCSKHGAELPMDEDASIRASTEDMTIVARPCPVCVAESREVEFRARLIRHGVPSNLTHATLNNWQPTTADDRETLAKVREFAKAKRGFLVLMGSDYGIGKSHLAVAVMREAGGGRFLTQNQLLLKLRATYRDDKAEDIIEVCKRVKLLVIDEVGLSSGGRDELPMLHEILNHRHGSASLRTVLTSNLEKDDFVAAIGERMIDRLRESAFASRSLKGKSHRGEMRKQYHGAA